MWLRNVENGKVRRIELSETEYMEIQEEGGICLVCDNTHSPVEPDA